MNEEQYHLDLLLNAIKNATFVCSVCGEIVFPSVHTSSNGTFTITKESCNISGGVGNKRLKENVCNGCVKRMSLMRLEEDSPNGIKIEPIDVVKTYL